MDQGKANAHLSADEKASVQLYADTGVIEFEAQSDGSDDDGEPSFIEEGKNEYESKRTKLQPPYKSTLHISPTSNIVERLFSRCGIIMRPHRRLMDPSTLEMLIMLRFNRDLWDERDVDIVMARNYDMSRNASQGTPNSLDMSHDGSSQHASSAGSSGSR